MSVMTCDKDYLKTLARGLELIRSFDSGNSTMTVAEAARRNGTSRASARRYLMTLERLGYAMQVDDRFQLTAKILDIGHSYLHNLDFVDVLTPVMRGVSQTLGKACSAAVLDGQDIVYVARIPSAQQIISINLHIGSRLPAYCTSMGRVLLAALPDEELDEFIDNVEFSERTPRTVVDPDVLRKVVHHVRSDGYALVDQELEESLRSIAIPVHNSEGRVVCAMNVGIPSHSLNVQEMIATYLPVLREAARKAQQMLRAS